MSENLDYDDNYIMGDEDYLKRKSDACKKAMKKWDKADVVVGEILHKREVLSENKIYVTISPANDEDCLGMNRARGFISVNSAEEASRVTGKILIGDIALINRHTAEVIEIVPVEL